MASDFLPRLPGARVRAALAAMTVLALAGCAGQPGEQVINEPQAPGDVVAAPEDDYSESTPEDAAESADPTTPAARNPDRTTKPERTKKPNQPATTRPAPAGGDDAEEEAEERPSANRTTTRPATRPTTPRPPVTTGPPQPGRTTRPPVTTGPPQPGSPADPSTRPPATTTAPPALDFGPDECSEGNGLPPHDGFQNGGRCVDTQMGEVNDAANNPSLLITEAPERVGVNQPFTIRVSTRNLIRDRFLPAGQGGYYVEMSILSAQGLVRGHFHTACRILDNTEVAPEPAPAPAFFVATEDSQGGAEPDVIEIRVPGLPQAGTFQCSAWAGDASHRIPMMQRANQIPALDSVRVEVR